LSFINGFMILVLSFFRIIFCRFCFVVVFLGNALFAKKVAAVSRRISKNFSGRLEGCVYQFALVGWRQLLDAAKARVH